MYFARTDGTPIPHSVSYHKTDIRGFVILEDLEEADREMTGSPAVLFFDVDRFGKILFILNSRGEIHTVHGKHAFDNQTVRRIIGTVKAGCLDKSGGDECTAFHLRLMVDHAAPVRGKGVDNRLRQNSVQFRRVGFHRLSGTVEQSIQNRVRRDDIRNLPDNKNVRLHLLSRRKSLAVGKILPFGKTLRGKELFHGGGIVFQLVLLVPQLFSGIPETEIPAVLFPQILWKENRLPGRTDLI